MKIKEYKDMVGYLTRPDTRTPEQRAMAAQKQRLEKQKRIAAKRAEYGLPPEPVVVKDPLTKNMINTVNHYDNGPYIVDNMTGEIVTESELRERFTYQDKPYPKQATPQQMKTLKEKMDKYKQTNGYEKTKPFIKPKQKITEDLKEKITEDPISVDTVSTTKKPEPPKETFEDVKKKINEIGTKKYLEDEAKAKEIGGIVYQNFKYGH